MSQSFHPFLFPGEAMDGKLPPQGATMPCPNASRGNTGMTDGYQRAGIRSFPFQGAAPP
jgi:hypothetical protein